MSRGLRQSTRRVSLRFEASSAEALRAKMPRITLLPGTIGRIELISPRVLGVCTVALGEVIQAPLGAIWSDKFLEQGMVVQRRGGFGGIPTRRCDAFVEWSVPAGSAQGQAPMQAPVLLIAVAVAAIAALGVLGWAIAKITALIEALVAALGPLAPILIPGLIIVGIAVFFGVGRR